MFGHEPVLAQTSHYRVELLVLSHLDHQALPIEEENLTDYTAALDFLTPPEESDEDAAEDGEPATAETTPIEDATDSALEPAIEGDAEEMPPDPASLVVHLPEMGPEMQDAWRRLRLSGPFRPLQHLAWEQSADEPFPVLRLHDDEVVLTDDPWAALRETEAEEDAAIVFGDPAGLAAETADDEEELPDPFLHYRLDGTAELRRSRFLHLHLDLEWREPVFDPYALAAPVMPEEPPAAAPAPGKTRSVELAAEPVDAEAEPRPSAFLVHRLQQNRQVKTGRLSYFDSPVLGVLALVTDVSDQYEDEDAAAEPAQ